MKNKKMKNELKEILSNVIHVAPVKVEDGEIVSNEDENLNEQEIEEILEGLFEWNI